MNKKEFDYLKKLFIFVKINIPKINQRRLCMIKYLGEMYNYRVVDSIIIFRTLYLLITYGVNFESKYFVRFFWK
jgi:regulator of nonsense transcripts 2